MFSFPLAQALTLRSLEPDDRAFLDHLYFTSRSDLHHMHADTLFVDQLIRMQQRMQMLGFSQTYPDAMHWLILQQDKRIGRLVVDVGNTDVRVVDVAIVPEAQGYGVGKVLLRAVQRFAQERQLAVSLAVSKSNLRAKNLYAQLGFVLQTSDDLFEQLHWRAQAALSAGVVQHAAA